MKNNSATIYTIGYSGYHNDTKNFINDLKKRKIDVLIDVRSRPYSAQFDNFNKEFLIATLKQHEIIYRNYSKEFGAQQTDRKYYSRFDGEANRIDYSLFVKSKLFKEGVDKINQILDNKHHIAIMCSEKDPIKCHRAIMISNALVNEYGFTVKHIVPERPDEFHKELESRLVDMLDKEIPKKKKLNQLEQKLKDELFKKGSIFDKEADQEYLNDIQNYYRIINSRIGWKYDEISHNGGNY